MTTLLRSAALVVALLLGGRPLASQTFQPTPLDSTASTARRASEVARLVIARDTLALRQLLATHAAAEFSAAERDSAMVRVVAALPAGSLTIARFDDLGESRVGVPLAQDGGSPSLALLVFLTPRAPHQIRGVGVARIGG